MYFIMIIGFWKLLGSAALVAPGLPRVKEWAYAGIFFNMTGAAVSHVVNHSAGWHVGVTLGLAGVTIASWALRPASRTVTAPGGMVPRRSKVEMERSFVGEGCGEEKGVAIVLQAPLPLS